MSILGKDPRDQVRSIRRKTLNMILEASKSSHPNEFGALLRAKEGVINELILLPGTISGTRSAIFHLHMLPIDFSIIGTVHSHPSPSFHPSGADFSFFERFGRIHIVVRHPYPENDWAAYNLRGERIDLEITD